MACMEHSCRECDHTWFDNKVGSGACPKCGGIDIMSTCDEDLDRGRIEDHFPWFDESDKEDE